MTDLSEMSEKDRTAAVATQLLQVFAGELIDQAEKIGIGGGMRAAAIEMDHRALISMVIESISEAWFYHPELLGPYMRAVLVSKIPRSGMSREDYDKLARPSTFIIAAALAGTLDQDNLPEQLGQFGLGPHAVDD